MKAVPKTPAPSSLQVVEATRLAERRNGAPKELFLGEVDSWREAMLFQKISVSPLQSGAVAHSIRSQGQPFSEQREANLARRRFQRGRLFMRGERRKVWVGRWREDVIEEGACAG